MVRAGQDGPTALTVRRCGHWWPGMTGPPLPHIPRPDKGGGNGELIPRGFRGRQRDRAAAPCPRLSRQGDGRFGARILHVCLRPRTIGVNARTGNR